MLQHLQYLIYNCFLKRQRDAFQMLILRKWAGVRTPIVLTIAEQTRTCTHSQEDELLYLCCIREHTNAQRAAPRSSPVPQVSCDPF